MTDKPEQGVPEQGGPEQGINDPAQQGPLPEEGGPAGNAAGGEVTPPLPPCPVESLGRRDGYYFFLSARGEYRALRARELNGLGIDSLFEGEDDWLRAAFPRYGKAPEGEAAPVIGYQTVAAARWLMRECGRQGFFDPAACLRGASVWLDEEEIRRGGKREIRRALMVHCGDVVLRYSLPDMGAEGAKALAGQLVSIEPLPAGLVRRALDGKPQIYPALDREDRPGSVAARPEQMAALFDNLHRWNWLQPVCAPRLLLGYIAVAPICGLLKWRPHLWNVAGHGSGKSELEQLVARLLGSTVLRISAPTEAAVRQLLGSSARAVMLDEVEFSELNNRAREVVELARLGSTDKQAPTARGGLAGTAQTFKVRACFYLTSILHPPFAPQDASRITLLEMGELAPPTPDDGEVPAQPVQEMIEEMAALGPAMRLRIILGFPRFEANLAVYRAAFAAAGRKARLADQYGTLLAGAHMLLSDEVVTMEQAEREVGGLREGEMLPDSDVESGPRQCLNHLLTSPIEDTSASGSRLTGTVATAVWKNVEDNTYQDALSMCGVRVVRRSELDARGAGFDLWVANDHRGMRRVYSDTRWKDGVWAQELKRLPGAVATPGGTPQRIGGAKVRFVAVPCELIERPWYEPGSRAEAAE